jgi:hypothetical protein
MKVQLRRFCMTRSGDKGDSVDISLFAPSATLYEALRTQVTAERVATFYSAMARGPVVRHEVPNVRALKFVVGGALGGGGAASLRSDNLGKAYGANLLHLEVEIEPAWLDGVPDLRHPESRLRA